MVFPLLARGCKISLCETWSGGVPVQYGVHYRVLIENQALVKNVCNFPCNLPMGISAFQQVCVYSAFGISGPPVSNLLVTLTSWSDVSG